MSSFYGEPKCRDCGTDTNSANEYYMLVDEVWLKAGLGLDDGQLCIGCVELRLGRELEARDFITAPINAGVFVQSARLLDRLSRSSSTCESVSRG